MWVTFHLNKIHLKAEELCPHEELWSETRSCPSSEEVSTPSAGNRGETQPDARATVSDAGLDIL